MPNREDRKHIWDRMGAGDVPGFPARIRSAVETLETAYTENRLAEELAAIDYDEVGGLGLVETYGRLTGFPHGPYHYLRADAIEALLVQVEYDMAPLDIMQVEPVSPVPMRDAETGDLVPYWTLGEFRLTGNPEIAPVRADRLVDSRYWRLGFEFEDIDITLCYSRALVRRSMSRLYSSIGGIANILEKFRPSTPRPELNLVQIPETRGFEHLILDIINEDADLATLAPVYEDFLEKTDIRVRYPWLARKRGARVQVTTITTPELHQSKLDAINLAEEYVFLSPRTLAEFVLAIRSGETDSQGIMSAFGEEDIRDVFGNDVDDIDRLASRIKWTLLGVLNSRITSPAGPSMLVPPAFRRLVRAFVEKHSVQSTSFMRKRWEAVDFRKSTSTQEAIEVEGDAGVITSVPPDLAVGVRLKGTVENIKDYGAFVRVGDITGLLHVSKIPGGTFASVEQVLTVGEEIDVEVIEVDTARLRVSFTMPMSDDTRSDDSVT